MAPRQETHAQVIPDPPERVNWKEAARLYVDEGLTYSAIARRLGHHYHSVRRALLKHGVPKHKPAPEARSPDRRRLRGIWKGYRRCCRDPRHSSFRHYGAKGIRLCPGWEDFAAFYQWAVSAGYRKGRSLALADGATELSPSTCRWISPAERTRRRLELAPPRTRRVVTAFGDTKGAAAWARDPRCKVSLSSLCDRIDRGLDPEEAMVLSEAAVRRMGRLRPRKPKLTRARPADMRRHWQRVIRLYQQGLSLSEIARRVGRTRAPIVMGLKRRGLYQPQETLQSLRFGEKLLRAWHNMHDRINDPRRADYKYYGARGVRVARVWKTFEPFHIWALASGYRPGMCLTRINRQGHYSPRNCRWVSRVEAVQRAHHPQRAPQPRWTVSAFGETKGPTAWSRDRRCRVKLTALALRLRSGMPPEQAITMPPQTPGGAGRMRFISAFGETKMLTAWARDRRCKVSPGTLGNRLRSGIAPEIAIRTRPYKLHVGKLVAQRSRRRAGDAGRNERS